MCIRRILHISALIVCVSAACIYAPQYGIAQVQDNPKGEFSGKKLLSKIKGDWKIDAAQLSFDKERNVYEAEGSVHISSGDRTIEADWAQLDSERQIVELRGNALIRSGRDWIRGEHIIWNLNDETGTVDGGLAYFAASQFYVQGGKITRLGPDEYELKDGFITSCDPSNSDWKIQYTDLSVKLDGIAWAKNTSFWVRGIPFFYTPILALPVQKSRQSGFLIPWVGSSSLNGIQMEVPFYWAIRQDMDATFYARYMTNRGFMTGLEYRIVHETWGEGIWLLNYLRDQADKDDLRSHDFPFQKADRYWLRGRHSLELPGDIKARIDVDLVSDRNYLREFGNGLTSFGSSDRLFREFSGRGILSDETILARESVVCLEKSYESSLLSVDLRYWDQLDRDQQDTTLQRLPAIAYDVAPTWIEETPFYYSLRSSLVNFWRPEGGIGDRLSFHPRIYCPLHWQSYINVESSFGFRADSYWVDRISGSEPWEGNLFPDLIVETSSRLNRVYPIKFGNYVAMEHSIRPEIVYEYVPEGAHTDGLPLFDRLDRDQSRHDIRYGFTTFLTAKEVRVDDDGNVKQSYLEFARLQVFEAFNIDAPLTLPDPRFNLVQDKGFSEVGLRLDVMPKHYLTLSYDTDYSPDLGDFSLQSLFMTLDSRSGHSLRLDYQFRKDTFVDELITSVNIKVLPEVYLASSHDYSLDQKKLYSQKYGVRYQRGCWGIGVAYENRDNDHIIAFSVNLLGLGAFGTSHGFKKASPDAGDPSGTF
ncbi:MAG: LPS-assembly protein LptD [Syntrophobacteraceae bacterium]